MNLLPTLFRYGIFLLMIAVLPALLLYSGQTEYIISKFWLLFGFVAVLTLMVIITVLLIQRKNTELYAQAFLAGTTVKILVMLFFILFFLRKNQVDKLAFAADFFYVYFLNTGFEVYGLLRNLRNQNLRQKT